MHPQSPPTRRENTPSAPGPGPEVLVDVVVLSGDLALFQAIRDAVGERNPVWRARTAAESVDLLLNARCGVLLVDMGASFTQPPALVAQIAEQFPDVVIVVAGRREDEALLAGLISDGLVYRFMHKPLSPRRAGMFLGAAIRAHLERRIDRTSSGLLPGVGSLRARSDWGKWLFVAVGVALFVTLLAVLLYARYQERQPRPAAPAASVPVPALADPVLAAARAARAAGRLESPAGRNALDLYAAAMVARPDNREARAGFLAVTEQLLRNAATAASTGQDGEARRLAARVLALEPDHPGARRLLDGLPPPSDVPASRPVPASDGVATADAGSAVQGAGPAPPAAGPPPRAAVPPVTVAVPPSSPPAAAAVAVPGSATPSPAPRAGASGAVPPRGPRTRAEVMPDPLTPRIVNAVPTREPRARPRISARGAPIVSGHPIAGYETGHSGETSSAAPATAGSALPERDLAALETPAPDYPAAAFRQRIEGWAEVEYTIEPDGRTSAVEVVAAEPAGVFDAAATAAVRRWRYQSRVVNGQPVAERRSVTLRFDVED